MMLWLDLASNTKDGPISLAEISTLKYFTSLFRADFYKIKRNKLVRSSRGANEVIY